jgi:deoxyadenosine/deoxycytidine kinase
MMEPNYEAPRYVAIEGPIRVGKTSLARVLADRLNAHPVLDYEGNRFLPDFYRECPGAAFKAQMAFLVERYRQLRRLADEYWRGAVVADYIFEKDKIFAYINLTDEELQLYDAYYDVLRRQVPVPDLVVYLQASPEVLRKRIARKNSPIEREISAEYLEEVVRAYDHFFYHYKVSKLLVVNTSEIDFVESRADLEELLCRLTQPVRGTQYFLPLSSE